MDEDDYPEPARGRAPMRRKGPARGGGERVTLAPLSAPPAGASVVVQHSPVNNQFRVTATITAGVTHTRYADFTSIDSVARQCWEAVCEAVGVEVDMPEVVGAPDEPPPEPERKIQDLHYR